MFSDTTKWIFGFLVLCIIIGTVRSRYQQALETGQTRSSIPLRTYADLWARLRIRLFWCLFPAVAIAVYLWLFMDQIAIALPTALVAMLVTFGGAIFDHYLLRGWAIHPPPMPDQPRGKQ